LITTLAASVRSLIFPGHQFGYKLRPKLFHFFFFPGPAERKVLAEGLPEDSVARIPKIRNSGIQPL
jgi:hypothetical protein